MMRRGSKRGVKSPKARKVAKKVDKKKVGKQKSKPIRRNKTPETALLSRDLLARYPVQSAWMILEVNDDGESLYERYGAIESEILVTFGDFTNFFIPAYIEKVKDKIVGMDLMGGYVFVEKTPESEQAVASMTSAYFKGRMPECSRTGVITGTHINQYKRKLLDCIRKLVPKKGTMVTPKVGTFKNVEGKVMSIARDRKSVTVLFKKSSRIVRAPVSVLNLDIAGDVK